MTYFKLLYRDNVLSPQQDLGENYLGSMLICSLAEKVEKVDTTLICDS